MARFMDVDAEWIALHSFGPHLPAVLCFLSQVFPYVCCLFLALHFCISNRHNLKKRPNSQCSAIVFSAGSSPPNRSRPPRPPGTPTLSQWPSPRALPLQQLRVSLPVNLPQTTTWT